MQILRSVLDIFFPKLCIGCNDLLLPAEDYLCLNCFASLDFVPYSSESNPEFSSRFYGKLKVEYTNSLLYYYKEAGISHLLLQELKYRNNKNIGILLGKLAIERWQKHPIFENVDEIIAVPLHPKKQKIRGYNQLELFCTTLSHSLNLPFDKSKIIRNTHEDSQTKKKFVDRNKENSNRFEIVFSEKDYGKHFLLIDDVVTTGATIEQIGKKILEIPNAKLSVFTMAMAR